MTCQSHVIQHGVTLYRCDLDQAHGGVHHDPATGQRWAMDPTTLDIIVRGAE
jgi:hypothetical protein